MAAPAITARVVPSGIPLTDQYQTTIAFARRPNINFWEKVVGQAGIDIGQPINTTTQLNSDWMTFAPRQLATLTPFSCTVAYDPAVLSEIYAYLIGQPGAITEHLPDGSTYSYFGYVQSFKRKDMDVGSNNQPEAVIEIVPTNWDPVNHVEASPLLVSVSGT